MSYKIGIDVGGTFTDFFLSSDSGEVSMFKVLTTAEDPSRGVLEGLHRAARSQDLELSELAARVTSIVHGTTVTTNAVLTRGGAKTGLLTTRGVRDALQMRRGIREEQYNNRYENVVPLIPRYLRLPVSGRLDSLGEEIEPLDQNGLREALSLFKREGVESVALCFMNSFANPAHEKAAAEVVREVLPGAFLSVSAVLLPTIRFYNRVSTTALDAYVGPVLSGYLSNLTTRLRDAGFEGVLLIMQSNGGVALPEMCAQKPSTTLLSGPAAGPRAGASHAGDRELGDCLVMDMGGTSFDVSLVQKGAATLAREGQIDRLRLALPMLEIATIGAGGGSIGWIDQGGLLRMGPQSAGSRPGPACYGRGGELPTCTDANVVLGYLDPEFFAGGEIKLDASAAFASVQEKVGAALGLGIEEAAAGMYRVINHNMAHGVREITVRRGIDPREYPLVVAGGAGSLHACMIAEDLGISTLIVPSTASVLCASGMLLSDLIHDSVRSWVRRFSELDFAELSSMIDTLVATGESTLLAEGVEPERVRHELALDLRYVKQYHEVTVPVPAKVVRAGDVGAIAGAFHAEHNRLYGYDLAREGTDLELINLRLRSVGGTDKPCLPLLAAGGSDPVTAFKRKRRAFVPERRAFGELPVYDGALLLAQNRIPGPALIERSDTTILVSERFSALVDTHGDIVLSRKKEGV